MLWPHLPGLVARGSSFARLLEAVARELELDPLDLASTIQLESAGTWDPKVRNPLSAATGLVQWMPSTWRALDMPDPATLTAEEQLAWLVPTYRAAMGGRAGPWRNGDAYLLIFYPAAAGAPDGTVIGEPGSGVAEQNKGFQDADGAVTAGSVRGVFERLRVAHDRLPQWDDGGGDLPPIPPPRHASGPSSSARGVPVLGLVVFAGLVALLWTRGRAST